MTMVDERLVVQQAIELSGDKIEENLRTMATAILRHSEPWRLYEADLEGLVPRAVEPSGIRQLGSLFYALFSRGYNIAASNPESFPSSAVRNVFANGNALAPMAFHEAVAGGDLQAAMQPLLQANYAVAADHGEGFAVYLPDAEDASGQASLELLPVRSLYAAVHPLRTRAVQ